MQDVGKWKLPFGDTTEICEVSREREGGPGGDDAGGKDGSSLNNVCSKLTPGEFCHLHCAFGLLFLFQFIPLSLEVV